MLQMTSINPIWVRLIKIVSPILIIGALYIDGTIISQMLEGRDISKMFIALGGVGSVVIVAHALEGIVAGAMAHKQGLNPLRYGIYTFLVGTVAFIDLMDTDHSSE